MKKNKKIFVFTFSDAYGGSESHILKFTQLLDYSFHWIVLSPARESIRSIILAEDLNVGYTNVKYKSFSDAFKIIRSLIKVINDDENPLLYSVGFLPSLFASILKIFKPSLNLITTRREMMPWRRWFHGPFLLFINLMSNKIETNSLYLKEKIKGEFLTRSKIYYLPNIISKSAIVPSSVINPFDELCKFKTIIGLVANVRPPKNIPLFIAIAEAILPKFDDVCFALVGRDSNDKIMNSLIGQKQLHPNFYFFENIKHKDIGHFYKTIDIFLFTSLFEGSPNVISEAMANGLPIVSSAIPATENLLQNDKNAFLCESENLTEFTNSIEKILLNPELTRTMGTENKLTIQADLINKEIRKTLQDVFYTLKE